MKIDRIEARLEALRPTWLAGETIALKLVVANGLDRTLSLYDPRVQDNARPVFVAALPSGVTTAVDNRGEPVSLDAEGRPEGLPRDRVVTEIAAGQELTAIIDPGRVLRLDDGGAYRVHLLLDTDSGPLQTETAEFSVEGFAPLTFALGSWTPPPELGREIVMVCALHEGSQGRQLVSATLEADASYPDKLRPSALRVRRALSAETGTPVAQSAAHSYREDYLSALAWGEGARAHILASCEDAPAVVELDAEVRQLIAPSLLLPDRTLELFAIAGPEAGQLLAVRGERFFQRSSPPPQVVARVSLPFTAVQAAAALRRQDDGTLQRGVAVLAADGRAAVYAFDGQTWALQAQFPALGAEALPSLASCPPALAWSDEGFRLGFLGWEGHPEGEGGRLELVQAVQQGEATRLRAEQLPLPATISAGRLVFCEPGQPALWAVWGDGRVFTREAPAGLPNEGPAALFAHRGSAYLLLSDPWRGLSLRRV